MVSSKFESHAHLPGLYSVAQFVVGTVSQLEKPHCLVVNEESDKKHLNRSPLHSKGSTQPPTHMWVIMLQWLNINLVLLLRMIGFHHHWAIYVGSRASSRLHPQILPQNRGQSNRCVTQPSAPTHQKHYLGTRTNLWIIPLHWLDHNLVQLLLKIGFHPFLTATCWLALFCRIPKLLMRVIPLIFMEESCSSLPV